MEFHHIIPISLLGENKATNWFNITEQDHKILHSTQDIPYRYIRQFRNRTNHILVPNSQLFLEKCKLWKHYFANPYIRPYEQLQSLNDQAFEYSFKTNQVTKNCDNFDEAVEQLIEQQRIVVMQILNRQWLVNS